MAVPIIMPRQGQSVESCIISKWLKKKGDKVAVGDIIFSYETDKAAFEFESPVEGTMLEIFFEEGDDVPVLTNVCVIGSEGEDASQFRPNGNASEAAEKAVSADEAAGIPAAITKGEAGAAVIVETQATAPASYQSAEELKISPRAKNLAEKQGVDTRFALGTGPDGRIIERDVNKLVESGAYATKAAAGALAGAGTAAIEGTGIGGRITTADIGAASSAQAATAAAAGTGAVTPTPSEAAFEDVKLTNIRKVIAKSMQASLAISAQLTLNSSFDATEITSYREKLKAAKEKMALENITLNDMLVYAVSRTVLKHPDLNAHFLDDKIRRFKNVNIGIAVDTDRGLMVPTIFNADQKSLEEISREIKALAAACQKGTIALDALKGASFTISNLGTFGVESFTPVINPPQTGILGIDTITLRPRESAAGVNFYPAMGLSLTFDHRAVDGAPAARFLQDLKMALENFTVLMAR